jgi:hypothetical protein
VLVWMRNSGKKTEQGREGNLPQGVGLSAIYIYTYGEERLGRVRDSEGKGGEGTQGDSARPGYKFGSCCVFLSVYV